MKNNNMFYPICFFVSIAGLFFIGFHIDSKLNKMHADAMVRTEYVTNRMPFGEETYPGSIKYPNYFSNEGHVLVQIFEKRIGYRIDENNNKTAIIDIDLYDYKGVWYDVKTAKDKKEILVTYVRTSTYDTYHFIRDNNGNIIRVLEYGAGWSNYRTIEESKGVYEQGKKWVDIAIKNKTLELNYTN